MSRRNGYTLRFTLSFLVIIAVLLTAMVSSFSGISVNRKSLSDSYLESNYNYAKKLASNTSDLLTIMQTGIDSIAKIASRHSLHQEELEILFNANRQYFNSILTVDANLTIQSLSPATAGIQTGAKLDSEASVQAIQLKKPMISEPYVAATGRLILLISSPIFGPDGTYEGFVGGTIYLEEDNALNRLLKEHFYGNGSYVYVVDTSRNLIFHPDKNRINTPAMQNQVVDKVLSKESGSQQILNSKGESFFAGYAYEPNSGWGIVSQTPVSVVEGPLKKLLTNEILQAFPLLALILLVAWWVSYRISGSLYNLAKFSEEAILHKQAVPRKMPGSNSQIYEVRQLYHSIRTHLNLLNHEIQIDGLTGLANRRTFDLTLMEWTEKRIPFSLILLDIDHFKKVNDSHGHLTGDDVLKYLASMMQAAARESDLCFRYGGEEFGILVNGPNPAAAAAIAERLRENVAKAVSPTGDAVTISVGVSTFTGATAAQPKDIIVMADHALYQSKVAGRNRTTVYSADSAEM